MSHLLTAHGAARRLGGRLAPAWTGRLAPPPAPRPPPARQQVRWLAVKWSRWLAENPTSLRDVRAVYDACAAARIFEGVRTRPLAGTDPGALLRIPGDAASVGAAFRRTPGLRREDWEARGVGVAEAVRIALRLRQAGVMQSRAKAKILFHDWEVWSEQAARMRAEAAAEKGVAEKGVAETGVAKEELTAIAAVCSKMARVTTKMASTAINQAATLRGEGAGRENQLALRAVKNELALTREKLREAVENLNAEQLPEGAEEKRLVIREAQKKLSLAREELDKAIKRLSAKQLAEDAGKEEGEEKGEKALSSLAASRKWPRRVSRALQDVAPQATPSGPPEPDTGRLVRRAARAQRHAEEASDREEGVRSKRRPILKKRSRGGGE